MKKLVSDSSSLISIASACLLWTLPKLNVQILIPKEVFKETIERPQKIRRFMFESDRIKSLIKRGNIQVSPVENHYISRIESLANNLLYYKRRPIKILHRGEIECLALLIKERRKYFLVDERTTRLMLEDIDSLRNYIENRTGYHLKINNHARMELEDIFYGTRVLRSSELMAYAFEKNLFSEYGENVLEHILWALKFGGCSITTHEISEYKTLFSKIED